MPSPLLVRPTVKRLFDIFYGISPTASAAKFTFWLEKLNGRKTVKILIVGRMKWQNG